MSFKNIVNKLVVKLNNIPKQDFVHLKNVSKNIVSNRLSQLQATNIVIMSAFNILFKICLIQLKNFFIACPLCFYTLR